MIADLKTDTERWEVERRTAASRGQPSNREPCGTPMIPSESLITQQ
jgi:hypothetical protein